MQHWKMERRKRERGREEAKKKENKRGRMREEGKKYAKEGWRGERTRREKNGKEKERGKEKGGSGPSQKQSSMYLHHQVISPHSFRVVHFDRH